MLRVPGGIFRAVTRNTRHAGKMCEHQGGGLHLAAGCGTLHTMKLKKKEQGADETAQPTGSGAAIAARFQLDGDPRAAKKRPAGVGKTSTIIALIAALAALGLIGFAAWLMYSDWAVAATA